MKNLKYLLICLFINSFLYAQDVEILWGEELKASKRSTLSGIIADDETGFYALKNDLRGRSSLTLEHFNYEMKQTKSVELELKQNKMDLALELILHSNNELFLFSSYVNKKNKQKELYVQTIDKKKLSLNTDLRKIAHINYSGFKKKNSGAFKIDVSRDESNILLYYNKPYEKGSNEKFGFVVFDNKINEVWQKDITLPYEDELFSIQDFEMADNGNIYLLGLKYQDKKTSRKSKREEKPNYHYTVLSYSDRGEKLEEYPIQVADKFLTDMQIAINEEGNIICGGFYSDEGSFSIKGSYFLNINGKTKAIMNESFKEFGMDFITQNMTEKQKKKTNKKADKGKNVELYEYDLDEIILRNDDGAILVGEQYFVRIITNVDANGNTSVTYVYHYNDIIVISISPEGEIEWTEKIPKRQITSNDGGFYSSYATAVVDDNLYFVYNDHAENLSPVALNTGKIKNFTSNRKNSVVTIVKMDTDGRFTRNALFKNREAEIMTRPKVCKQINDNEMIVFGQRKSTHRFAKVKFPE